VPSITRQLSDLADVIVNRVMALAAPAPPRGDVQGSFAVIALGQLGGREMSYTSHLELMYVFDAPADDDDQAREYFQKQGANLTTLLSGDGEDPLYRTADVLFHSLSGSQEYYASRHHVVDRLALMKARPIAGDAELGRRFLDSVRAFVFREPAPEDADAIALDATMERAPDVADLVRRLETCVQLLQLRHAGRARALERTGTLDALNGLATEGVITGSDRRELVHAYEFLKGAMHARQLMPDDASAASANLEQQVNAHAARVDAICRRLGGDPGPNQGKD
jgi:glutamate-ammonia-ligase adenylyltransferase